MKSPRAFTRLSFHKNFTLEAALPLVEQLADLGISHLCTSPLLAARPGIGGGLGVIDHTVVAPEIGGESALRRLSAALHRRGMSLIAEVAPGHMAAGGTDNPVWLDVLEWGRDSTFASWFDIDWRIGEGHLRQKLLAPFLDRPYGTALAEGALTLAFESGQGRFVARHRSHIFPICPLDYPRILESSTLPAAAEMARFFSGLSRLRPAPDMVQGARERLNAMASTAEGRAAISSAIAAFDGYDEAGCTRLHALLERQSYRLAWWQTARDELNWRARLDAANLIALRVERPDVFDATHATLFRLYEEGHIDGLSITGWDLLSDPEAYASRLRLKLGGLAGRRPADAPAGTPYMMADAALAPGVSLPHGGELAGTTGADAQEAIGAVLHDSMASGALSDSWMSATGNRQRYDDAYRQARREAVRLRLGPDLQSMARALHDLAGINLATRDISLAALKRVVEELAIALRAPRTRTGLSGRSEGDNRQFADALTRARRHISPLDQPVADQLARWLGNETGNSLHDIEMSGAQAGAIARFEQFTAAIHMAAAEETLPLRYSRLISRNEIGSDPTLVGLRPAGFHERMAARLTRTPAALTPLGGPAQLLGADARMRLAVITETPRAWDELLRELQQLTVALRTRLTDGAAPDPSDEVILYQALIAAWPLPPRTEDPLALGELHDMAKAWQRNVIRTSGLRTSHIFPNLEYERGCADFLSALLEGETGLAARRLIATFVTRIAPAGIANALSQCVLAHTVPGVPNVKTTSTGWDFALGNTETNRAAQTARTSSLLAHEPPDLLLESWRDGRVKQALITRLLRARADYPTVFAQGDYTPLVLEGRQAEHAIAFMRRHRNLVLIVIVSRLTFPLLDERLALPRISALRWADTAAVLPTGMHGPFQDLLNDREIDSRLGRVECAHALSTSPVAVLLKKTGAGE